MYSPSYNLQYPEPNLAMNQNIRTPNNVLVIIYIVLIQIIKNVF